MFQIPVIVLLLVGAVWKTVDLVRAPRDRVLRILVSCLVLLVAGQLLSLSGAVDLVDAVVTAGTGQIVFNAVHMSGLYALILFFVSSSHGRDAEYRRQFRINASLLVGVVLAMIIAVVVTPAPLREFSLHTPHMARPSIAAFYVVGNAYFVYAYSTSGLWALRSARMASRHLAFGLRIMALSLFGLTVTSVDRVIWVYLQITEPGAHSTFNTVNWLVNDGSLGLVLVGICYSAGVQLIRRWRSVVHYRWMHDEITALWEALATAYPELVLHREPPDSRWWRLHLAPSSHERFYRRLIECRDSLVHLSPHLTLVAPNVDLAHSSADEIARYIDDALALKPTAEESATASSAVRIASPAANDVDSDARRLVAVSQALRERRS